MPDVAAFDFDGTLTDGRERLRLPRGRWPGARPCCAATAALAPRLAHAALVGGTAADRTKERLFVRVLAGVDCRPGRGGRGPTSPARHLDRHLRPEVQARFDWHRRRGDRVVIVSASPEVYVRVAGERLGADGVDRHPAGRRRRRRADRSLRGSQLPGRGEDPPAAAVDRRPRAWTPAGCGPTATAAATCGCCGPPTSGSTWDGSGRFGRLRGFPGLDAGPPD